MQKAHEPHAEPPLKPAFGEWPDRLTAAELGFGVLFWATHDAVIIGDAGTGCIVLANPAALQLFGYTDEEIIGLPIERLVSTELRDRHLEGIAAYTAHGHGRLVDTGAPVELAARHKDSRRILIELSLTPLRNEGDPRNLVAAIARDSTERRRLETERATVLVAAQDYSRRLEELSSLKASFTAMVAHELTSPVSAIRALSDLLLSDHVEPERRPALIEAIRAEADLLRRLTADIQAAASVEGEDFVVRPAPVAVISLIADAAAFARILLTGHPFVEEIDDDAAMAMAFADRARIGQVLRNLLGNAAKHTPAGTAIALRAMCREGAVRLEVADHGQGIPARELERVFEKFGRGRNAEGGRIPGVGLGLYLSRRIVRAHGGELTVVSTEGEGTAFALTLPEAPEP